MKNITGNGVDNQNEEDELAEILKALETGPPEKGGPGKKMILGIVIAVLLISIGAILVLVNRKATVPNFAGHTVEDAEQLARDAGLNLTKREEYSTDVEEGIVISQNITKGMKVKRRSEVELVVSQGVEMVQLPEFVGESLQDAQKMAQDTGVRLELSEAYSDDVAEGIVMEQQEKQGASVEKDSQVKITVSLGQETIKIPNFVGMTLNDATIKCSSLGINFSTLQEESDTVDENEIIRQSVDAGSEITEDTQLYLIVSKGKKSGQTSSAGGGSTGGGSGGGGSVESSESQTDSNNSPAASDDDEFIYDDAEWGD